MQGKLILILGPSGSGKGTLINHVRPLFPRLKYPVSCTTRAMRPGEKEGEDYYFVSKDEFQARVDSNAFLEWAEYGGNLYGTPYESIVPALSRGEFLLEEIEVQGARQILDKLPSESVSTVFIDAGPWEQMEDRIRARAPISEDELEKRKGRYEDEVVFKTEADAVISNKDGELESAKLKFEEVINSIL